MNNSEPYAKKPIIILGANHSGTRVLVEVLERLGSASGKSKNDWREEELFLSIHKNLISRVHPGGWNKAIFDLNFIRSFEDRKEYKEEIQEYIANSIEEHYPEYRTKPWHWKCPTSALFMPTWLSLYPDAYYIHLVRKTSGMAESFLRRRQFLFPPNIHTFNKLINKKIAEHKPRHYLKLEFESLSDPESIKELLEFLSFLPNRKREVEELLLKVRNKERYKHLLLNRRLKEWVIKLYLLPFRGIWKFRNGKLPYICSKK